MAFFRRDAYGGTELVVETDLFLQRPNAGLRRAAVVATWARSSIPLADDLRCEESVENNGKTAFIDAYHRASDAEVMSGISSYWEAPPHYLLFARAQPVEAIVRLESVEAPHEHMAAGMRLCVECSNADGTSCPAPLSLSPEFAWS